MTLDAQLPRVHTFEFLRGSRRAFSSTRSRRPVARSGAALSRPHVRVTFFASTHCRLHLRVHSFHYLHSRVHSFRSFHFKTMSIHPVGTNSGFM